MVSSEHLFRSFSLLESPSFRVCCNFDGSTFMLLSLFPLQVLIFLLCYGFYMTHESMKKKCFELYTISHLLLEPCFLLYEFTLINTYSKHTMSIKHIYNVAQPLLLSESRIFHSVHIEILSQLNSNFLFLFQYPPVTSISSPYLPLYLV